MGTTTSTTTRLALASCIVLLFALPTMSAAQARAGRNGVPPCLGKTVTIAGTDRSDSLVGTQHADVIDARDGHDRILALGGDDTICPGAGDDHIFAGAGDDLIASDEGRDYVGGNGGIDTMDYRAAPTGVYIDLRLHEGWDGMGFLDTLIGIEGLSGSPYRDVLRGGMEDNTLHGREGKDDLYGGGGVDVLDGGAAGEKNWCVFDANDTALNCM